MPLGREIGCFAEGPTLQSIAASRDRALGLIQVNGDAVDRDICIRRTETDFAEATIISRAAPETPHHFAISEPNLCAPRIAAIAWENINAKGIRALVDALAERSIEEVKCPT